jgi:thioredoxin 1
MKKLVIFYATWCGPCQMYKKTYERLAQEMNLELERIDIESEDFDRFEQLEIRSVPTTAIIEEGVVKSVVAGVLSKTKLMELLK